MPVMIQKRAGFTLIEIMVAMVIFAIMMTALFTSFRTGMKAYSMGTQHTNEQQLGRFAVNQVAQDLRNIFYKPESQYNVARRQQEAMVDAANSGLETAAGRDVVDENLPDLGPPIDLSFAGEDGGEIDQLSLVRSLGYSLDDDRPLWGLARITYYVVDGNLYRSVDDITKPETDEEGNLIPKATRPHIDKLAENCVGFDLKYGYYYEEDWHLADSWDSNGSQYRNPETEEDDDVVGTLGNNASGDVQQTGAAAALQTSVQQQEQQNRADELPGWVELTFQFAPDKERPELKRTYKQTIMLASKSANETYVPETDDEELKGARADSRKDRDRGSRGGRSSRGSSGGGSDNSTRTNGPGSGVSE